MVILVDFLAAGLEGLSERQRQNRQPLKGNILLIVILHMHQYE